MLNSIEAPCVLASERSSHPDDERRSAEPSRFANHAGIDENVGRD
jgi:hypothetical protein